MQTEFKKKTDRGDDKLKPTQKQYAKLKFYHH